MTGVAVQPAGLGAGRGGAGRRGAGGGVGGVGGAGGGHRLQLHAGDPHVSSTPSPHVARVQGPLHAVEMFYRRKPDVFLGPVCPYVLAPVVR